MGCRTVLKSAMLIEARRPVSLTRSSVCASFNTRPGFSASSSRLHSSHNDNHPGHSDDEQAPPQEAVLKAISAARLAFKLKNMKNHFPENLDNPYNLDQKVNSYPTVRGFTAIGTGGDDFVKAMVISVESLLELSVPQDHVKQKLSSGGKYVSVNIGPVQVISSEQVQAVYNAMRRDDRMKYFL